MLIFFLCYRNDSYVSFNIAFGIDIHDIGICVPDSNLCVVEGVPAHNIFIGARQSCVGMSNLVFIVMHAVLRKPFRI